MHFSKFVIASLLALTSSVTSFPLLQQVIVTVTSTITVVTVTITPLTTSTTTIQVTVTGSAPSTTKSTSTRTVTVTASAPATTSAVTCPLGLGGSCGLWDPAPNGCRSCANGLTCRSIMYR
ncbi:hypothetical protein EG329_000035 [Mollisiaceae sp. DMI_Dod_QoI]|nr:hypothetical protein EG329_000035 [Helotiales sp. DMI_Dod_QoI]